MSTSTEKSFFAPQLFIPSGVTDISFYSRAFGATALKEWRNEDGSIHVAEFSIDGSIFQIHEERPVKGQLTPNRAKGVTSLIGLFVRDVDLVIKNAIEAGAILLSAAQDYEYGYRQGSVQDPFGQHWMIEMKINST